MKMSLAIAAICTVLSSQAFCADRLEVSAAGSASVTLSPHLERIRQGSNVHLVVNSVGTGQAMLDLIDGRANVAAVSTTTLWDAIGAARVAAWAEGKRLVNVDGALVFHPILSGDAGAHPLAFVTHGSASPQLVKVMDYLRSENGRKLFAQR
jgi:hypothetical protein